MGNQVSPFEGDVGDEQNHVDTQIEPILQRPEGAQYWSPGDGKTYSPGWYKLNPNGKCWFWRLDQARPDPNWALPAALDQRLIESLIPLAQGAPGSNPPEKPDSSNCSEIPNGSPLVPEHGEDGCLNTKCIDCGESLRAGERVQCDFCAGVEDLFVYDVQQRIDNKELAGVDDTDVVESDHIADVSKKVGIKYDSGKPRFDLIPPLAEQRLAEVLTFGAEKYAPGNWQHVDNAETRYIAAALRHINAQRAGEHSDPETGLPHLAHAMCCLAFVIELQERDFKGTELELSLKHETRSA